MNAVIFPYAFLLAVLPIPAIAQACVQATQRVQVPEQIHLVGSCQAPPETHPKLSFLLSESGIDIYRVEWPRTAENPVEAGAVDNPHYPLSVTALFVYQDEKVRQIQIKSLINDGEAISWLRGGSRYDSTLPADWTPVLGIKYITYTFTIFGDNRDIAKDGTINPPKDGGSNVILVESHMYAPEECYSYGTRCVNAEYLDRNDAPNFKSSEIASYFNQSPIELPQNLLAYRVAIMLGKLRMAEAKPTKYRSPY
jgi:hypothetical protein